jgi:hypothetical protein
MWQLQCVEKDASIAGAAKRVRLYFPEGIVISQRKTQTIYSGKPNWFKKLALTPPPLQRGWSPSLLWLYLNGVNSFSDFHAFKPLEQLLQYRPMVIKRRKKSYLMTQHVSPPFLTLAAPLRSSNALIGGNGNPLSDAFVLQDLYYESRRNMQIRPAAKIDNIIKVTWPTSLPHCSNLLSE